MTASGTAPYRLGFGLKKYSKNLEKGDGSPFSCFGESVVIVGSMRNEEKKFERKYGGNERKEGGKEEVGIM